jgi:hypothetical protein
LQARLQEDTNYTSSRPSRSPRRRSTINEHMMEADEDNFDATFADNNSSGNRQMDAYLRFFRDAE